MKLMLVMNSSNGDTLLMLDECAEYEDFTQQLLDVADPRYLTIDGDTITITAHNMTVVYEVTARFDSSGTELGPLDPPFHCVTVRGVLRRLHERPMTVWPDGRWEYESR